jgi:S1-C subfamily serine protease
MRYTTTVLLTVFILYLSGIASENLQTQILTAKNRVLPALVHIEPVKEVFSDGKRIKIQVTGSGIIFSEDGYILTNNHVAEKARYVFCTLANRDEVRAEVVGLDALTDLAVLKLDLSEKDYKTVPYAKFGDSDSLEVGEIVMALGSPLGLSRSLSLGVISSIDRYFEDVGEMVSPFNLWIQTDWQEIKDYRKYKNTLELEGVLISDIEKGSPGEKAGLKPGDLAYEINDKPVNAVYKEELPKIRKFISEIPVKSTISFKYLRDGKKYDTELITKKRGKFEGNEFECDTWGLSVKELTPRIIKNLKIKGKKGVLVSGVIAGSPADEGDIFRGYVIRDVDGLKIEDLDQFKEVYNKLKELPDKGWMVQLTYKDALIFALIKEE